MTLSILFWIFAILCALVALMVTATVLGLACFGAWVLYHFIAGKF